jgi:hypothetical protein
MQNKLRFILHLTRLFVSLLPKRLKHIQKMINVICVHTAMALVEPLTKTFAELMPESAGSYTRQESPCPRGRRVPQSQ